MTCVVGLAADGGVYLSADSSISDGDWCDVMVAPKVWAVTLAEGEPLGVGFAGLHRASQVVRYHLDWLELDPVCDEPEGWVIARLVPAMRAVLESHGVPGDRPTPDSEPEPGSLPGTFLVALSGRLFEVGCNWQVHESAFGASSIGSGALCALGALSALDGLPVEMSPGQRLDAALAAAERFTPTVSRPFTTIFVPAS